MAGVACSVVALAFLPAALWRVLGDDAHWPVQRAPSLGQEWQSYNRTACRCDVHSGC